MLLHNEASSSGIEVPPCRRWGSYPEYLQECSAFQQIYQISKKNYAAFQLATTSRMKRADGFFTAHGAPDQPACPQMQATHALW